MDAAARSPRWDSGHSHAGQKCGAVALGGFVGHRALKRWSRKVRATPLTSPEYLSNSNRIEGPNNWVTADEMQK